MDRIKFEEVSEHVWIGEIVNCDDIKIGVVFKNSKNHAPDAAKTIDCNFMGHNRAPTFYEAE